MKDKNALLSLFRISRQRESQTFLRPKTRALSKFKEIQSHVPSIRTVIHTRHLVSQSVNTFSQHVMLANSSSPSKMLFYECEGGSNCNACGGGKLEHSIRIFTELYPHETSGQWVKRMSSLGKLFLNFCCHHLSLFWVPRQSIVASFAVVGENNNANPQQQQHTKKKVLLIPVGVLFPPYPLRLSTMTK